MNQVPIRLNDLLQISDLSNFKIRMLTKYSNTINPLDFFRNENSEELMGMLLYNYSRKFFKIGQTVIGLFRLEGDSWLLFNIIKITKDLDILSGPGYEYETVTQYQQYYGRVIVNYKNKSQNLVRNADSMLNECIVDKIIEDRYGDEEFPGYENINISWDVMSSVLKKSSWRTALQNQKGVYLITDPETGKMYVGSAYGENMLLGRWEAYLKNKHGGNVQLKKLKPEYIRANFRYSILDIFKSTVEDKHIIQREKWWKNTLMTRDYGHNKN